MLLVVLIALSMSNWATARFSYRWEDPNGIYREVYLGNQAEWVFITIEGQTLWLSGDQAKSLSRQLNHAADSARTFRNHMN